jgi:penicillin-binding protein 1A
MTAAYTAINNRGLYVAPTPFEEIIGPDGKRLYSRAAKAKAPRQAVSSDVADAMTYMLEGVVNRGTGTGAGLPDRPAAGKTGTAEGARDLWFIGSIPQLTTSVWYGYDQNWKTGSSSAQAAYAWGSYMRKVIEDLPVKEFPPKPELNSKFIPYVPPKRKEEKSDPSREGRWDVPELIDGPPPGEQEGRWEPPTDDRPQQGRSWEPEEPRRWEPQSEPLTPPSQLSSPEVPAPPAPAAEAPAPAAPPAALPPPPPPPPPPVAPPPPIP